MVLLAHILLDKSTVHTAIVNHMTNYIKHLMMLKLYFYLQECIPLNIQTECSIKKTLRNIKLRCLTILRYLVVFPMILNTQKCKNKMSIQ